VFASAALDLAFVGSITHSPDPASMGNTLTLTASFRTNGGAVTLLRVLGGIDGTAFLDRTYANIEADKTRTDSFTWTAAPGWHTVWFELDHSQSCGDSNYANNRIEKSVWVDSGELPDLTVRAAYDDPNIKEGEMLNLAIYVSNIGDKWSAPCRLVLRNAENNVIYAPFDVPKVPNGSIWYTSFDWKVICGATLKLDVDVLKTVAESNEDNNSWTKNIKCGHIMIDHPDLSNPMNKQDPNGPDLIVKILKIHKDASDSTGKTAIVEYEVDNIGKAASVSCAMDVKRGGVHDQNIVIPAIGVGQKFSGSFKEGYVCSQQTILKVDSNYQNAEINELNNTAKKTILCLNLSKDATKNLK
jgi:subtilase family serine protease